MTYAVAPERVLRIIAAAGIPLRGHNDLPNADLLLGPKGARWLIVGDIVCDEKGEPINLSGGRGRNKISGKHIWKIVANIQGVFETLQDSLGDNPKRLKNRTDAFVELAPALRKVARKIDKAFPMKSPEIEALAHLVKAFSPDIDVSARTIKRQAKRAPEALKSIVKTLEQGFEKLYGMEAKGSADSPFIRFADAFLREGRCAYSRATIQEAFYRRDPRKRLSRTRPSKGRR